MTRLQFFERYGRDGTLRWKRLLPMTFTLIEHDAFEAMARTAGFRVAHVYGDYARAPFDPARSAAMIWFLEKGNG